MYSIQPWYYLIFDAFHLEVILLDSAIGIDDSFLMLAAWHETPRHLPVVDRVGASMKHAAVSISITTLTDALAFLIGAIAPLPAVCATTCATGSAT